MGNLADAGALWAFCSASLCAAWGGAKPILPPPGIDSWPSSLVRSPLQQVLQYGFENTVTAKGVHGNDALCRGPVWVSCDCAPIPQVRQLTGAMQRAMRETSCVVSQWR